MSMSSCAEVVVLRGDAIARDLNSVGPGGGNDLRAVALVVGRGNGRHGVGRGGDIRTRCGELGGIHWRRIRVDRRPLQQFP